MDGSKFAKVASINPILRNMDKLDVFNKEAPPWIDEIRKRALTENDENNFNQSEFTPNEDDLPF